MTYNTLLIIYSVLIALIISVPLCLLAHLITEILWERWHGA